MMIFYNNSNISGVSNNSICGDNNMQRDISGASAESVTIIVAQCVAFGAKLRLLCPQEWESFVVPLQSHVQQEIVRTEKLISTDTNTVQKHEMGSKAAKMKMKKQMQKQQSDENMLSVITEFQYSVANY